jgi:hypothetical protein
MIQFSPCFNELFILICKSSHAIFDYLHSFNKISLEETNRFGDTTLTICLTMKDMCTSVDTEDFAIKLIQLGANINPRCRNNDSLLHIAVRKYFLGVAKCLIERGVDINAQNDDGKTPLRVVGDRQDFREIQIDYKQTRKDFEEGVSYCTMVLTRPFATTKVSRHLNNSCYGTLGRLQFWNTCLTSRTTRTQNV